MHVVEDKPRVTAALKNANGNIARAAVLLGVSRPYLSAVVKRLELTAWAVELRVKYGAPSTGRPPNAVLEYLDTVAHIPAKKPRRGKKASGDVVTAPDGTKPQ